MEQKSKENVLPKFQWLIIIFVFSNTIISTIIIIVLVISISIIIIYTIILTRSYS